MHVLARDDDDRLLDEGEVKAITRLSHTTRWRLRKQGLFPQYIAGRYNSLGQIRSWLANEKLLAEAQSKALAADPVSQRGRPTKKIG
jgi:predicted DNA-binding transcriptional regulator AlpA